jgi:hypothetical protein
MSPARSTVQIVGDLSAAGAAGCYSGLNVSFYQFQRPHPAVRNVGNGSKAALRASVVGREATDN